VWHAQQEGHFGGVGTSLPFRSTWFHHSFFSWGWCCSIFKFMFSILDHWLSFHLITFGYCLSFHLIAFGYCLSFHLITFGYCMSFHLITFGYCLSVNLRLLITILTTSSFSYMTIHCVNYYLLLLMFYSVLLHWLLKKLMEKYFRYIYDHNKRLFIRSCVTLYPKWMEIGILHTRRNHLRIDLHLDCPFGFL
jgi:hypothetical protein